MSGARGRAHMMAAPQGPGCLHEINEVVVAFPASDRRLHEYTELAITNIESETSAQRRIVPFAQAFRFWLKLVFISFGGLAVAVAFARLTAFGRGLCSVLVIFAALWQFQGRAQIGDMKKKHSQNEANDEFAFPSDPLVMEKINAMIKEKEVSTDQISKRSGRTVGHLSMCLVKTPTEWSDTQLESSEWLNVLFEGQDKDALFEEVIEIYGSESYPLLSRIVDMYADVIYSEAEIGNLLEESERAMRVTKDQSAIVAVKKIFDAAERARDKNSGLFLASP